MNKKINWSYFAILSAVLGLLLGACAGAGPASKDSVTGFDGLPGPAALTVLKGGSAEKSLSGAQFIAQSRCFAELDSLRLNVSIEAVQRNGSELGWASYRFTGVSGLPQSLTVNTGLPLTGSRYYIGVAGFADLRWHWFGPFDSEVAEIDLGQVPQSISSEGDLLFSVVARGHNVVLHHSSTLNYASPEV